MNPNPFIALITNSSKASMLPVDVGAIFLTCEAENTAEEWQCLADAAEIPLIQTPLNASDESDGYWTTDVALLKSLRKSSPDAQLVGIAQEKHKAMLLAEAGADLILFAVFDPSSTMPILFPGQSSLAHWWSGIAETPCAIFLSRPPEKSESYGDEGMPEFYMLAIEGDM